MSGDNMMKESIERTLATIHEGQLVEIRALGVPVRGGRLVTMSGYFDDYAKAAAEAATVDELGAEGVYMTLQTIHPGLIARAPNMLVMNPQRTTSDRDVIATPWILVDCDAVRPSGISSTDEELAQTAVVRDAVCKWILKSSMNGRTICADSGNGAHLLFKPDVDRLRLEQAKQLLTVLEALFGGGPVSIDTSVTKPAQLTKLYGTTARKGYATPDRPHRRSYLYA